MVDGEVNLSPEVAQENERRAELPRAFRAFVQLGGSLACTWAVAILMRFALPRHLGPERFGDLNFAEAFAGGFFVFASLGVDTYSMREVAVRPRHASDYFGGVQLVRLVISLVMFGAMTLTLYLQEKPTDMQWAVAAAGLSCSLVALNGSLAALLQAVGKTGRLAMANVIVKLIWAAALSATIAFFDAGAALALFVLPTLFAELLKTTLLVPATRAAVGLKLRIDLGETMRVLRVSLPFYLSVLTTTLCTPLNLWVLDARSTDPRELGWYAAATNLGALALLFTPVLQWVLLPMLSRAHARSPKEVSSIASIALEACLLGAVPFVLMACLGSELWVLLAFGDEYGPATGALQVAAAMFALNYVSIVVMMSLIARGETWYLSVVSTISVVVAPSVCLLTVPWLGSVYGLGGEAAGAAIAVTVSESVTVLMCVFRAGSGLLTVRLGRAVAQSLLIAGLVALVDGKLLHLGYARLLIDGGLYVVLVLATRTVNLRELRAAVALVRSARSAGRAGAPASTEARPAAGQSTDHADVDPL